MGSGLWRSSGVAGVLLGCAWPAQAGIEQCMDEAVDAARLACYDRESGRNTRRALAPPAEATPPVSALSERWELAPEHKTGTFQFRYHAPIYILPVKYSTDVNRDPVSPTRGAVGATLAPFGAGELPWQEIEAKFQLSFKVKAWENLWGDNGDLWFAYTQQSYWQIYNKDASAPFRETNYAPELINTWRIGAEWGGWNLRLLNLGLVHQSNGKSDPVSRSWNRLYLQAGVERGNFALLVRPWYRLKEDESKDDNPDIEDYVGRGDLIATYRHGGHVFGAVGRHSLRGGDKNHGALQLDWAFPLSGNLRGHVQLFTGYGESLIDYNHRQTTFGVGISLAEWM